MAIIRNIFMAVSEDIIDRNILQTEFLPIFLSRLPTDRRLILLVQPDRVDYFTQRYGDGGRVGVVGYKRSPSSRLERIIASLMRSGINTRTNLWSKMRSYHRGDSTQMNTLMKRVHAATMGNLNWYKKMLRRVFLGCGVDALASALFEQYRPVSLVSLSLTNFDFDVILARTARQNRVPVIGMVRSWDNLSSHGLLRVLPDRCILQNVFLENVAKKHQAFDRVPIDVVGIPHYDRLNHVESFAMSRAEFCSLHHLDPKRPIIFYGAMGEMLFLREGEMPSVFEELISTGQLPADSQILFRTHPKFKMTKRQNLPHLFFDTGAAYIDQKFNKSRVVQNDLLNQIFHSDVVVTGASTIAIDAAIQNKPIVCVAFDANSTVNYWDSAARFYDHYTHFEALVSCGGVLISKNKAELASQILRSMAYPDEFVQQRKDIVKMFVGNLDGAASKRLASLLLDYCG